MKVLLKKERKEKERKKSLSVKDSNQSIFG